jgi:putative NIF3 family GTP cyclohydrolase 1 type 2
MDCKAVVSKLNSFAPLKLGEKWDNVGLLLGNHGDSIFEVNIFAEPTPPFTIKSILVTNDLTEEVLKEAIDKKANMIISYHPPIFSAMKRFEHKNAGY